MDRSAGHERGANGSVILSDEDAVKQVLVDSVLGLWDVVNNLTRLKPSRRDRYRVTIFGSARIHPGTFGYEETKRVAHALAELGCDIITGGGPGLMQAANEGAALSGGQASSVGIRVDLPFEQDVNSFVAWPSSTGHSSRACTSSCSPPMRSWWRRAGSAPCSRPC
jgi:hypothetical protein